MPSFDHIPELSGPRGTIASVMAATTARLAARPLAISPAMNSYGEAGLFWAFAAVNLAMVGFFVLRRGKRPVPANPAPFVPSATFSPTGAELRVTDDLRHAAQEHPPVPECSNAHSPPVPRAGVE